MKHHLIPIVLLCAVIGAVPSAPAAVPLRWTVETSRLQPAVFDVVRGETLNLEAALFSYGKPISVTDEVFSLFYQTNGMGSAWWTAPARPAWSAPAGTVWTAACPGGSSTNAVTNVVAATFTPSMDPGATVINGFLGSTGDIYRAAFTLRYRHGPGAAPNVIDAPPRILDLEQTVVVNPPWPTQEDFAATTTVMRADLKAYVDDQIEGAGTVSPQTVKNIVDEKIGGALILDEVPGISDVWMCRRYGDIVGHELSYFGFANHNYYGTNSVPRLCVGTSSGGHGITPNYVPLLTNIIITSVSNVNYTQKWFGNFNLDARNIFNIDQVVSEWALAPNDPPASMPDNGLVLTNGSVKTKAGTDITAADVSAYGASDGQTLAAQVSVIGSHLNAEDAHFVSTNYDSSVRIPEAYVEIRMSNSWITIWREMTRWNKFAGAGFDWDTWTGFNGWKTNVDSELASKADRAWGAYDSETGGYSPEGYTQISSSNILIASGMAYQRNVTSGGAVWVLQCNTGTAHIGGDTNGFFRITDGDGVTQFEIIKGDKQELGADASGITVDNSTTPPTVTIPYSVEAAEHPTLQVCNDLANAQWKSETEADCVANVTWSGSSGSFVATVQSKTSPAPQLFVKATYLSGGETYIHNIAPVGMDSIMLNGTKYYLGSAVINGNTVLTLHLTPPNP